MPASFGEPNRLRFSLKVGLPIATGILAVVLAVSSLIWWSSRQADQVAIERQERLVALVVSQLRSGIAHDQESVTVWDDAVGAVLARRTDEWVEYNLGSWMHTYFSHDGAYILDPEDRPFYASIGGETVAEASFEEIRPEIAPLAAALREKLRNGDMEGVNDQVLSPGVAELTVIGGRPAIASVKPIVSDTGEIEQVPGSEYLHVAVRFLDASFIAETASVYLFEGLRFSWRDDPSPEEASHALTNSAGEPIGYLVWRPYRPGSTVLSQIAPALALSLLVVLALVAFLLTGLRKRSMKLRASEAKIHHLALHDPLTGLPNRFLFNDRLDRTLVTMPAGGALAVLYLDLDRFKQVNDSLGHPAGDELIRQFAIRLLKLTRENDTVARLGGDEFTILLPDLVQEDVESLCARIIESVRRPFDINGSQVFVGVSVGVALAPAAGSERIELMRKADIALYHAKSSGRSRYEVFGKDMDALLQTRRNLERDLRVALDRTDQIQVHYQPLYSASGGEITGVEALLRWRHPEHGWISPQVFIPVAEESGLIDRLGEFSLNEACRAAAAWPIETVAVNVSAIELHKPSFAVKVANTLLATGMQPGKLELELTESALTDHTGVCEQNLEALRELGIRLALDDFGTGFSSLGRLQQLKVDRIKIDRSFVHGFGQSGSDEAIVQAIVDLARATGLKTTAEGVETDAQRQYLQQIGCDELQGFLLSRPVPVSEIDGLLGVRRRSAAIAASG